MNKVSLKEFGKFLEGETLKTKTMEQDKKVYKNESTGMILQAFISMKMI